MPAFLAFSSSVLTALPLIVIRMPLSPREMALSIALIWVWVSPSDLPAATVRDTSSLAASFFASFSIDTKYGLLSVLRINDTPVLPDEPEFPQATSASEAASRPTAVIAPVRFDVVMSRPLPSGQRCPDLYR